METAQLVKSTENQYIGTTTKLSFVTTLTTPKLMITADIPFYLADMQDSDLKFEWTIKTNSDSTNKVCFEGYIALAINEIMRNLFHVGGPLKYDCLAKQSIEIYSSMHSGKSFIATRIYKFKWFKWVLFHGDFDNKSKYIITKSLGAVLQSTWYYWRK